MIFKIFYTRNFPFWLYCHRRGGVCLCLICFKYWNQSALMSCQRLLQTKAVVKDCFIGYVFKLFSGCWNEYPSPLLCSCVFVVWIIFFLIWSKGTEVWTRVSLGFLWKTILTCFVSGCYKHMCETRGFFKNGNLFSGCWEKVFFSSVRLGVPYFSRKCYICLFVYCLLYRTTLFTQCCGFF